jgi:hypothetical protein
MATLLIGKSESSCSVCGGYASPTVSGHYEKFGMEQVNGKWVRKRVKACGEKWTAIQSTYFYPGDWWAEYVSKPSERGFAYPHLFGLPAYDALGKQVGVYGSGLDIQTELDYDGES